MKISIIPTEWSWYSSDLRKTEICPLDFVFHIKVNTTYFGYDPLSSLLHLSGLNDIGTLFLNYNCIVYLNLLSPTLHWTVFNIRNLENRTFILCIAGLFYLGSSAPYLRNFNNWVSGNKSLFVKEGLF